MDGVYRRSMADGSVLEITPDADVEGVSSPRGRDPGAFLDTPIQPKSRRRSAPTRCSARFAVVRLQPWAAARPPDLSHEVAVRRCSARSRSSVSQAAARTLAVPGREDPGPLRGDGNRVLEVGRERPVPRVDGPVVGPHPHFVGARVHHRLDGEDHALRQLRAGAGLAHVGDLGVLVHLAADSVAHERSDHGEAVLLHPLLHRVRDVAQAVAHPARLHRLEQGGAGGGQQALGQRGDVADRNGDRGVRHPAVEDHARVNRARHHASARSRRGSRARPWSWARRRSSPGSLGSP